MAVPRLKERRDVRRDKGGSKRSIEAVRVNGILVASLESALMMF